MRGFRYVVADVFTDTPLTGNQLAVFTDARTEIAARREWKAIGGDPEDFLGFV